MSLEQEEGGRMQKIVLKITKMQLTGQCLLNVLGLTMSPEWPSVTEC